MRGLKRIQEEHVDRAVLIVEECEPNKNASGRWSSFDESNYYPFETLNDQEQKMILNKKHYFVVSLVNNEVNDIIKYDGVGVEVYRRTYVIPLLPKLKPESPLYYITEGGAHIGEMIRAYAKEASKDWTPEIVEEMVEKGIKEYKAKTQKLMEKAGVYNSLKKIKQKKYNPI